jgi:ribosomal protein L16/L10AE
VKGKGTLREYFAEIDSIKIIAKIKYEKREITFLSKALGKIPITKVEIEITERGIDTERSKKICERIAKRLHFMTMRFGG